MESGTHLSSPQPDAETSIELQNLSKTYRVWHSPLARLKSVALGKANKSTEAWKGPAPFTDFHALKPLDLSIFRGESIGIVGKNGSGKSTLLQMIAGTLTPSSGNIVVKGRIGALLELGSGFNPEFTGRENISLNASIFGLTPSELAEKMDAILDFADIGPYVDLPLKTYSSGMVVRLAFAVQVTLDPEILIVDEALSVGDEAFQKKCFGRLETLKERGVTLIFVTHGAELILSLCDRALLLHAGQPLLFGKPKGVVGVYQRLLYDSQYSIAQVEEDYAAIMARSGPEKTAGDEEVLTSVNSGSGDHPDFDPSFLSQSLYEYAPQGVRIHDVRIETLEGKPVNQLVRGESYVYAYDVLFESLHYSVRAGCLLRTRHGSILGGMVSHTPDQPLSEVQPGTRLEQRFQFKCSLTPDTYFFNAGVVARVDGEEKYVHRIVDALMFRVKPETFSHVVGPMDILETAVTRIHHP